MYDPATAKCENGTCKNKNALYERNGITMCRKCMEAYDKRKYGKDYSVDTEGETDEMS